MNRIHVLEEQIANQIAAGEVVERPSSVVKELIENAIDAHCTRIRVVVDGGGMASIRVEDDGNGIEAEDIPLAFVRHATSKIERESDLYELSTMGFRGEALASVASVARVTLVSRTESAHSAVRYRIEGGCETSTEPCARGRGTTVQVEDLFYNTPARRKFLRSEHQEASAVVDVVQKLALASTDVAIRLEMDGRTVFSTRGSGDLRETLAYVQTGFPADRMLEIEKENDFLKIRGLISPSHLYRATRDMQMFFVNGRVVRSMALTRALEEAYRHRIPIRRHPAGILHLSLNPAGLDVNIHPSKIEIKFSMEQTIRKELLLAVGETLEHAFRIPDLRVPEENKSKRGDVSFPAPSAGEKTPAVFGQRGAFDQEGSRKGRASTTQQHMVFEPPSPDAPRTESGHASGPQDEQSVRHPEFENMRYLGSVESTYLILAGDAGLYLMDQHAAHERLRYERLMQAYEQETMASQMLIEPVTLSLAPRQQEALVRWINRLRDMGIVVELTDTDAFRLRGVPAALVGADYDLMLQEVLEGMERGETSVKEAILTLASCRGAVRAGDALRSDEVRSLLHAMSRAQDPYTCPHGRPTVVRLGKKELEHMFMRSG